MCFHFQMFYHFQNVLSFLECVFIFKMCFYSWNVISCSKCVQKEHNFLQHYFFLEKQKKIHFSLYLSFHSNINDVIIHSKSEKHLPFYGPSNLIFFTYLYINLHCNKKYYTYHIKNNKERSVPKLTYQYILCAQRIGCHYMPVNLVAPAYVHASMSTKYLHLHGISK